MIITAMLTIRPGTKLGQSVSNCSKISHVKVPNTIDNNAPVEVARLQYIPNTKGANKETKLKMDDSPTSS